MNDSEDLKNDDQLLSMMEEMQNQIEDQQKQLQEKSEKNSEAQKTISRISSENLTLRNKLQEKSERIEKMNESDLIVKKNEELEKKIIEVQNSEKKTREEAEAKVEAVKQKAKEDVDAAERRYHDKVSSLASREYEVSHRERAVSARENNVNTEINIKAEKLVKDKILSLEMKYDNKKFALERQYENDNSKMLHQHKRKMSDLNAKYKAMVVGYRGMVYFTLFYSILTTVITAYFSEAFVTDFKVFFMAIRDGGNVFAGWIRIAAYFVARLGNMIPQPTIAIIIHWLLVVLVYGVICGTLGVLFVIDGKKYVKFFKEKQADESSVFVGLVLLAFSVHLADPIKSILSINLVGLILFVFIGYTVIRGIIQTENVKVKKGILKCVGIVAGCVVVMGIIIHFFGVIGLIVVPIGGIWAYSER